MLTKKAAIKTVEKFINEVKNSGIHIRRAVLFGSYAHGKPHKWSDIDLAIAADEFRGVGYDDHNLLFEIKRKPEFIDISPRTYNTRDFTSEADPFVEIIMEHGIEINCKTTGLS